MIRIAACLLLCALAGLAPAAVPRSVAAAVPRTRPGAVLVKLRGSVGSAALRQMLPNGASVEAALGDARYALHVPTGAEQRYARRLAALPGVAYAQLDHAVAAQLDANDARYAEQWNMRAIGMPAAWDVVTDASPLVIAILDTGVELGHPDLSGQLWSNPGELAGNGVDDDANGYVDDIHGWHFYHIVRNGQALAYQDASLDDPNGHGTHVAGIIGAAGNDGRGVAGVAWRARLMPVRVLEDDAVGWESDVLRGLDYAIGNGARIVNLSLGLPKPTPALAEAVAAAHARGVLLVAAAGNNGAAPLYPAAFPSVLSVGASDRSDRRAGFSARGTRLDLLAPGVDVLSTWNGVPYFTRSGTSMAAPHVAGAAALLWTHRPGAAAAEIRDCLLRTSTDLQLPGRDDDTGWGLLNAGRALESCPQRRYLPLVGSG